MNNLNEVRKNWYEIKEELKMKFIKLTGNDSLFEEYQKTEMMNKFQQKLGISDDEIQKIISDL